MVVGLGRVQQLAGGPCRERALGQDDVVVGAVEGAEHAAVLLVADTIGEVLQERAAAGDVDQLHPAADAQQRHVALDRRARERDLEGVALGHRVDGLRMRLLAVAGGVDVGAAREHQAVDQLQPGLGLLDQHGVGREHHHQAAGALHGLDVAERQQRRVLVPDAPARALERGADADHRSSHAPHHRINASRTASIRAEGEP